MRHQGPSGKDGREAEMARESLRLVFVCAAVLFNQSGITSW